jgi:hypothetical protein
MNLSTEPQKNEPSQTASGKTIDSYLAALRRQLRELTDEDANDIVEEIRMHILDKTEGEAPQESVAETLVALGTPAELANKYCTEEMLARGRAARSPAYIARSVGRWALLTLGGIVVFLLSVLGYGFGGFLFMLGMLKLLHPGTTGVYGTWTDHDKNFRWQSGGPNTPDELLGWWLLPIGLVVGAGLLLLTFRFGNWSLRTFWRPRRWQEL